MSEIKFFVCEHCGNLVRVINDAGVPMICCGQKMTELKANSVDASQEKHVPVVEILNGEVKVTVGSVEHPMVEEHSIQWIYLLTDKGDQFKKLTPGITPQVKFKLADEKPIAVYEYCNLHGLWVAKV
ncbi:MAG: desulfoferrodoxin [Oscillospiraceae bacterium]|jgi:superoxide reductase|nr:desulfoferrodoxin [Oscillospiraceae bacterium]